MCFFFAKYPGNTIRGGSEINDKEFFTCDAFWVQTMMTHMDAGEANDLENDHTFNWNDWAITERFTAKWLLFFLSLKPGETMDNTKKKISMVAKLMILDKILIFLVEPWHYAQLAVLHVTLNLASITSHRLLVEKTWPIDNYFGLSYNFYEFYLLKFTFVRDFWGQSLSKLRLSNTRLLDYHFSMLFFCVLIAQI